MLELIAQGIHIQEVEAAMGISSFHIPIRVEKLLHGKLYQP